MVVTSPQYTVKVVLAGLVMLRDSGLHSAQLTPVKSVGQTQTNLLGWLIQEPPFLQGKEAQLLI